MDQSPSWKAHSSSAIQKFLAFYRTWRFPTAFITASQMSPSSARLIQSGPSVAKKRTYLQPAEALLASKKRLLSTNLVASTVKLLEKTRRLLNLRNEVRPTANVDTVVSHGNCSRATQHVNRNETMQYACPANYVITDSSTWRPLQGAARAISCIRLGTNTALGICIINTTPPVSIISMQI
jgi:hypothetical protein